MADPPFDAQRGVRRTTVILLVIIVLLIIWYVVSDRVTPYSQVARVKAYVIAVVPDVSGYVEEVPVKKNQLIGPAFDGSPAGRPHVRLGKRGLFVAARS